MIHDRVLQQKDRILQIIITLNIYYYKILTKLIITIKYIINHSIIMPYIVIDYNH